MLNVKQGGIKYHFFSFLYDSTWDWTQVSWAIGKQSNHYANVELCTAINKHQNIEIYTEKISKHDFIKC